MTSPTVFAELNDGQYMLRSRSTRKNTSLIEMAIFEIRQGKLFITSCLWKQAAEFTIRGNDWVFAHLDVKHSLHVRHVVSPSTKEQMFARNSALGTIANTLL
jgi:hypothetical protein